jgi:hypothetical protein
MRRIVASISLMLVCLAFFAQGFAQTVTPTPAARYKIAVFVPLYLDSVFDSGGEYKLGNTFPRYSSAGLEFYEGIHIAADSLKKYNVLLDIHVFDSQSPKKPLSTQLNEPGATDAQLFIGMPINAGEAKLLAETALKKNIPFISPDYPNDAGIVNNPSYVILKSTLKTHCEGIYKFIQRKYSIAPVIVFTKKGVTEDRLKSYFEDCVKTVPGSKVQLKFVVLDDAAIANGITNYFDSTRTTVSIVTSVDKNFNTKVVAKLAELNKNSPTVVIGMPFWDSIEEFNKKEYKGLDIIYSTAFYNARVDPISTAIVTHFKQKIYSRPSDMVFRGYECLFRFGRLLSEKGPALGSNIGDKKYKIFTEFDIQPVLNRQTNTLDYFENKKLYFIRKTDGQVKLVM